MGENFNKAILESSVKRCLKSTQMSRHTSLCWGKQVNSNIWTVPSVIWNVLYMSHILCCLIKSTELSLIV